jgi:methionyl-tRNA formyltransferase
MKIAYFGYNSLSSCLPVFTKHGHEIAVIFTGNDKLYADQVIHFSQQHNIPWVFEKPNAKRINEIVGSGVDCFFSAEYPWRIPIPETLKYAINAHPTLLPFGRGPTPVSYMLLNDAGHSGVTLHKMTNSLDEGEILIQKPIAIGALESYDTLAAKIYIETPLLLDRLLSSLDDYYVSATPQQQGSYWPSLTPDDQTINWDNTINQILKQFRAFGSLGVYAHVNSQPILITSAEGTSLNHSFKPGAVVCNDQTHMVLAVQDGILTVAKTSLFFL